MATSKTGGSRAYLRGRVGSDVYSIGKDANGKKQQVVRSLAENVKNPQTKSQMFGRMVMSTVMQAVSAMRPIIDHSFDNVPAGQPNVSEFIKRNYNLIATDAKAHESADNTFGLNKYQEKGAKMGAYVISVGSAIGIKGIVIDGANKTLTIALSAGATMGDLKSALGLTSDDYFTACAILANGRFAYERFHINPDFGDTVAISAQNVGDLFAVEGNVNATITLSGNNVVITLSEFSANAGIIVSRKVLNGYQHSSVTLAAPTAPSWTSQVALATYPVGQERFLNGGGEESEVSPFEPEPFECHITAMTVNGSAWDGTDKTIDQPLESCVLVATIDNYDPTHLISFGENPYHEGFPPVTNSKQFEGTQATLSLSIQDVPAGTPETQIIKLFVDGHAVQTFGKITWEMAD